MKDYIVFGKVTTLAAEPSDLADRYVLTGVASNTALSGFNNSIVTAKGSPNKLEWHYEPLHHGDVVIVFQLNGTSWSGIVYQYSAVDGLIVKPVISVS